MDINLKNIASEDGLESARQILSLEQDGFIHRKIYEVIPPKVEYTLTELEQSFLPVLETMFEWSEKYLCPDYVCPYHKE